MRKNFSMRLSKHLFLIDLKPSGVNQYIASYVLKSKKVAIVETGPATTIPNLFKGLQEIGVKVDEVNYVVVSHIHLDHSGGAGHLLNSLPRAKLVVHRRGAPHVADPKKLWSQSKQALGQVARLYGEPSPVSSERIIVSEDDTSFDLGEGLELRVVETVGHASHHQSFYEKKSGSIFPGDTAGIYISESSSVIPTTPPPFHLDKALASIEKLKQLKPKLVYFSHFGEANNALEKLEKYATQLRLWADIIAHKIGEKASVKEMEEEITLRDPNMKRVVNFVAKHPILNRGVILQDIRGFVEYLKYTRA
ncbi:MAG: MBL fold metallo-hydrolase [Candidatus Bathyarchaeota archaeon]|nr:MAG: MBL fold metallo-hydrolase [Candidatus Bathyarchaeota archaeon]